MFWRERDVCRKTVSVEGHRDFEQACAREDLELEPSGFRSFDASFSPGMAEIPGMPLVR